MVTAQLAVTSRTVQTLRMAAVMGMASIRTPFYATGPGFTPPGPTHSRQWFDATVCDPGGKLPNILSTARRVASAFERALRPAQR
jgi:hypothetical protein